MKFEGLEFNDSADVEMMKQLDPGVLDVLGQLSSREFGLGVLIYDDCRTLKILQANEDKKDAIADICKKLPFGVRVMLQPNKDIRANRYNYIIEDGFDGCIGIVLNGKLYHAIGLDKECG